MTAIREVHAEGWCVRLDLQRQVLRLEIPEPIVDRRRERAVGPPLSPTLPLAPDGPVSIAALLLKSKQFDDGLYAAVELAAQHGAGRFSGKSSLLRSLAATLAGGLPNAGYAATVIHTACQLGGVPVALPEAITESVAAARAAFLRDDLSRPLGFYSWTPELAAIFRQDRFLQRPIDLGVADDLDRAVARTTGAPELLDAILRLNARLTNPPKKPTIYETGKRPFIPPSRSPEVAHFERLYEVRSIPDGFDLMAELIRRVRSGEIDLKPTASSGWYDQQVWSLEPLVAPDRVPERSRLEPGKRYRKHLEDLFRGGLALVRETHVKQAGGGWGGARGPLQPPIRIHPGLSVEPLPSLYARRAAGYRFVRSVLEESFGAEALSSMHRVSPMGSTSTGLAEELPWMESLFAGTAETASREVGMPFEAEGESARCFSGWRATLGADRDVASDCRMMIPVFFDVERRKTKVWAFLGWRTTTVDVDYRVPPAVLGVEREAPSAIDEPPPVEFFGDRYEFAVPVLAEVYVKRLLDRDDFRRHCDRFRTRESILANLR